MGDTLQILTGDSEGSLYTFQALESWREQKECLFKLEQKIESIGKFGIIQVMLVVSENLIFTISAD